MFEQSGILVLTGLVSGLLAGLLGIGGGTILVPCLVALQYTPVQAVATSSLAIAITAVSGSLQNWRMGYFDGRKVLGLGLPALVTAQGGVELASRIAPPTLLAAFSLMLIGNIFLVNLRQRLIHRSPTKEARLSEGWVRLFTGGAAGLLAGLFGIGGGVIMVPLQMLLLGEPIKAAIQTSLGVIFLTAIAAVVGHGIKGNLLVMVGLSLGIGGLIGAQISTRFLPKLPDKAVNLTFNGLLLSLALYTFWQAVRF